MVFFGSTPVLDHGFIDSADVDLMELLLQNHGESADFAWMEMPVHSHVEDGNENMQQKSRNGKEQSCPSENGK